IDEMRATVDRVEEFVGPLRDLGFTLVHGDYWFYNVLLPPDGRRVMVDWQAPMIWSGLWELAYFVNLLRPMNGYRYRLLPVPESDIVEWYRSELWLCGLTFDDQEFDQALR